MGIYCKKYNKENQDKILGILKARQEKLQKTHGLDEFLKKAGVFDVQLTEVDGIEFKDLTISNILAYSCRFKNCVFENVVFRNSQFEGVSFTNCIFKSVRFERGSMNSVWFRNGEMFFSEMAHYAIRELSIEHSKLTNCFLRCDAIVESEFIGNTIIEACMGFGACPCFIRSKIIGNRIEYEKSPTRADFVRCKIEGNICNQNGVLASTEEVNKILGGLTALRKIKSAIEYGKEDISSLTSTINKEIREYEWTNTHKQMCEVCHYGKLDRESSDYYCELYKDWAKNICARWQKDVNKVKCEDYIRLF